MASEILFSFEALFRIKGVQKYKNKHNDRYQATPFSEKHTALDGIHVWSNVRFNTIFTIYSAVDLSVPPLIVFVLQIPKLTAL